jgi:hypothetical protein
LCNIDPALVTYQDDTLIVIECPECQCPMVVLRQHTTVPSLEARDWMEQKSEEIEARLGPDYIIDRTLYENKEHVHYHVRKV